MSGASPAYPMPELKALEGSSATPIEPADNDKALMQLIEKRWKFYRGNFPNALTVGKNEVDFNVKPNRLASIVDTGVDYLLKDSITIDVSGVAGKEAQAKLDAAWGSAAKMMTFFIEAAQSGAVGGDLYWRVLPPGTPDNLSKYARFVAIDPQRMSVIVDPDDCRIVLAYIVEYSQPIAGGRTLLKRQCFTRIDENASATEGDDVPENWTITNYTSTAGPGALQQVGPTVEWSELFSPIIHNKNLPNPHEFHGLSDIEDDLVALQNALVLAKSNANKLGHLYSHPVYWTDMDNAEEIDISPAGAVGVGMGNTLQAIDAHAAITDLLAFIDSILEDMDERSAVPQIATGRIKEAKFGQLSGTAIKLLFMRLVAKTLLKRLLYGQTFVKASQIHLYYAGYTNAFELQPAIHWPEILPNDEAAFWSTVPMKQAIGISNHTIGTEADYDMDKEAELSQQEDQQKLEAYSKGLGMPPAALAFAKQPLPNQQGQQQQNNQQPPAQQQNNQQQDQQKGQAA